MAIPIQVILEAMNHHQPPTPINTDTATDAGFICNNINQKKFKILGYVILLAQRQRESTPIQIPMGKRIRK